MTPSPMETLLNTLGAVFSQFLTWIGTVVTTVVNNPMLLIVSGIMITGAAIGLFSRLLSRR